ncbi:hypothetical protein M378DRAFT_73711 [Amanita muscaria Koide BX008]|uniref:PITH domain-containing protein n=1 Tax=Amanita muscaria (strain Koide BX008) TaxID=946122 RepID=A0A0C2SVJ2_AMAMK|nr:hypothetical protein M378DRAFT_73711 [Amanita muscaria Koide BX008]
MPQDHHCGHDCDAHNHELGSQDNLYPYIDRQNVVALNTSSPGSDIIKPWHQRLDESVFLESDADDQIIIRVPFTGSVRLRAILLKSGPAEYTPSKVILYANELNADFNDIADMKPTQEFCVAQGREVGEYAVMAAKFSNISSITLFFPSSQGADAIQISYLGFLGSWSERTDKPIITVYEARPNIADHGKIQGMEGNFNVTQT